jgi:hypothetical protein
MGAEKLVTLLSCVLALFGPTVMSGLLGRRSKHHTETGHVVLGAWNPSLTGTWTPRQEWNGLVLLMLGV